MLLTIGLVRLLLFIFNGILAVFGIAVLVISSLILKDVRTYSQLCDFLEPAFNGPLISMIVVSVLVLVIAALGVFATIREHENLMMACIVLLFATFIAAIADSAVAFMRSNDVGSGVRDAMASSFMKYMNDATAYRNFNTMQRNLRCCGVDEPLDFILIFSNMSVPASCCQRYTGEMCKNSNAINDHDVYQKGCFDAVQEFVSYSGVTLGSVTFSLAFFEIIGIVLYIFLLIGLQNEQRRMGLGKYQIPRGMRMTTQDEQVTEVTDM